MKKKNKKIWKKLLTKQKTSCIINSTKEIQRNLKSNFHTKFSKDSRRIWIWQIKAEKVFWSNPENLKADIC